MSTDPKDSWLHEFTVAAAATDRVIAIALGGSHGRKLADSLSDWDLFFLVERKELTKLLSSPPGHLTTLIPSSLGASYPSLAPEFGLKYTILSSQVGLCDLFFLHEDSSPTPLRSGTTVLWEKDERLTRLCNIALSESRKPSVRLAHNDRLAVQLATEYAGLTKSYLRNRPLQAWHRTFKTVNLILGAQPESGHTTNWWYSYYVADQAPVGKYRDTCDQIVGLCGTQAAEALAQLGELCVGLLDMINPLSDDLRTEVATQLLTNLTYIREARL